MTKHPGNKKRINIFEACELAGRKLIEAGFEVRARSRVTETTYYGLPGRPHSLRVSSHVSKGIGPIGTPEIVARITFNEGGCETPQAIAISDNAFMHMIATAIGIYMLKSNRPMRTRYHGKKGTWLTASHGMVTVTATKESDDGLPASP